MVRISIYLDDDTAELVSRAAHRDGTSKSAFVAALIRQRLDNRLPESLFALYGSWKDDREPEEILREIRAG